ncbi:hypothetical protein PsorP6_007142 [Peronosclerospora sorghi]|uniref:Uncharacterized protein n=1 Tax=Peronosclerospora sorghi TaxID=230839 RepID=A0ACC0W771_9STRA|nr:hypothetical protein PsorP6_007142 [Peronosclerospora sorghi]
MALSMSTPMTRIWSMTEYAAKMIIFRHTFTWSMPYERSNARASGVLMAEKCSYMNDSNEYVWNAM